LLESLRCDQSKNFVERVDFMKLISAEFRIHFEFRDIFEEKCLVWDLESL